MTQYVILCATSPAELAQKITEAVSGGWKLEGGICGVARNDNEMQIMQLMSKRMSR